MPGISGIVHWIRPRSPFAHNAARPQYRDITPEVDTAIRQVLLQSKVGMANDSSEWGTEAMLQSQTFVPTAAIACSREGTRWIFSVHMWARGGYFQVPCGHAADVVGLAWAYGLMGARGGYNQVP
jgi:hypothetical protein